MHRLAILAPALIAAAALGAPAAAQSSFMPDVIGQAVANSMNQGMPEPCLDGLWEPTEEQAARFNAEAEPAFRAYLELAAAAADPTPAFTSRRSERSWSFDGEEHDLAGLRDPWAARIARLELVGLRLGGLKVFGRGIWRAFAADGTQLGTYDGIFRRRSRGFQVSSLDLVSAAAEKQPPPLDAFCAFPGDIEEFRERRAERIAEVDARRAARQAEREARAAARAANRR